MLPPTRRVDSLRLRPRHSSSNTAVAVAWVPVTVASVVVAVIVAVAVVPPLVVAPVPVVSDVVPHVVVVPVMPPLLVLSTVGGGSSTVVRARSSVGCQRGSHVAAGCRIARLRLRPCLCLRQCRRQRCEPIDWYLDDCHAATTITATTITAVCRSTGCGMSLGEARGRLCAGANGCITPKLRQSCWRGRVARWASRRRAPCG